MNWIPVSERLPKEYDSVIIWGKLKGDKDPTYHEAYLIHHDIGHRWYSVRSHSGTVTQVSVTHWAIPEPPEE
jgi:hypothetical protein